MKGAARNGQTGPNAVARVRLVVKAPVDSADLAAMIVAAANVVAPALKVGVVAVPRTGTGQVSIVAPAATSPVVSRFLCRTSM